MAIALRYAARSDVGLVRRSNQDSAYAGPHLLVVADGMGGHAGGDVASSLAIGEMVSLDGESHGADALNHLSQAMLAAHHELLERVREEPPLTGMGTTVTALLRTGNRLALAHIGDSRAYFLRDGVLVQLTRDHTFVQSLVDEGRLTPEEAEHHPQRSVLMRVLSDVVDDVHPDLSMREARPGDRYLLCSDGLSGVVSFDTIRESMITGDDPAMICETLVQLALRAGAPDNVTCIVADIVEAGPGADSVPVIVGAATLNQPKRAATSANGSAAERAAALTVVDDEEPDTDEPGQSVSRLRWRKIARRAGGVLLVACVLAGGGATAWQWVQRQYFVGIHSGAVAIFRGLPEDVGPVRLSSVAELASDIVVTDLPAYSRQKVSAGIQADTAAQAHQIVQSLRDQAAACRAASASATPTPSPSTSGGPTPSGTATTNPTASGSGTTGTARATSVASTPSGSATVTTTAGSSITPSPTPTGTSAGTGPEDCGGFHG